MLNHSLDINYLDFYMNIWIQAARLRTLPLSLSGIILGTFIATAKGKFNVVILILACLTTLFLQVLSNYANDYGDGIKGTDNEREGEERLVAAGKVTPKQMKLAILIVAGLSLISAITLLSIAYLPAHLKLFITYILLGLLCIWAAIQYTVGKRAYGYRGMGDMFVYICFGLIAVIGTTMLYTQSFELDLILPASAIGLLSMAVLNLNNMRDLPKDKEKGKITIPVKIGYSQAKKYHSILLFLPFILTLIYFIMNKHPLHSYIFILLLPLAQKLNITVTNNIHNPSLDAELKKTAILTFFFAILVGIGINL